jgi:V/A-type H+-transporting ATPase subunit I
VGAVHLAVGLALGVLSAARDRHAREAVARAGQLGLLVAAAVAAAATLGAAPAGALRPALWAAGGCVAASALAEGPLALLDAVLTGGNVLSYARLMALGAASVMLAEAANGLAQALPGAFGAALAVLLHGVNFTLGLLSPAIAALRLQYVEFFEKFYRDGGHPFRPLTLA